MSMAYSSSNSCALSLSYRSSTPLSRKSRHSYGGHVSSTRIHSVRRLDTAKSSTLSHLLKVDELRAMCLCFGGALLLLLLDAANHLSNFLPVGPERLGAAHLCRLLGRTNAQ